MADYNYPKSFCNCVDKCEININNGIPSNLSLVNCCSKSNFNNQDYIKFKPDTIQPIRNSGYEYYNTLTYSNDFEKIGPEQYFSPDPRLYDSNRNIRTILNIPPIDGSVKLSQVYNINPNYGNGYNTYTDVNAGQISYYNDKSIENPYFSPNFVDKALVESILYKDPMGAIRPQYNRYQIENTCGCKDKCRKDKCHKNKCKNKCRKDKCCKDINLSFINDTQSYREDLMSLQMRKINEQKWSSRWSNLA